MFHSFIYTRASPGSSSFSVDDTTGAVACIAKVETWRYTLLCKKNQPRSCDQS